MNHTRPALLLLFAAAEPLKSQRRLSPSLGDAASAHQRSPPGHMRLGRQHWGSGGWVGGGGWRQGALSDSADNHCNGSSVGTVGGKHLVCESRHPGEPTFTEQARNKREESFGKWEERK